MDLKKFKMENGMSCVTLGVIILWERVRDEFSRNIFSLFSRKTARKTISRNIFSLFSRKTARKTISRNIFSLFSRKTARKTISRNIFSLFSRKQYARRSHVTFLAYFPEK